MAVSNTSGLAGIAHWINTYYRLTGEAQVDKNSALVQKVKAWVDQEYESGRVTVLTDEELTAVIETAAGNWGSSLINPDRGKSICRGEGEEIWKNIRINR